MAALALALAPPVVLLGPSASAPAGAAGAAAATATTVRLRPVAGGVSQATLALRRRTTTFRTTGYSMAGVTWTGVRAPGRVAVRWPDGHGGWVRWRTLPRQADLPGAREQRATRGTQPVWTGRHRQLQVEVLGHRPRGLRLSLIDTGPTEQGEMASAQPSAARGAVAASTARRATRAPQPALLSRRAWGADPSWRNGQPSYIRQIKQVHIHHTATANDYAPGDVPGLLRGMYYYHTHSLGWFDIAYNFLVDRFGRTWVGRSGGADRAVRGAHTLGFNHESVGIALIGRFGNQRPTASAMKAVVDLAAWKLDMYGGHPRRTVVVRSEGSDRFPTGAWVRLPTIDGHRDTNETSCPGTKLYDLLPRLRNRVGKRVNRYDP
ncbi:N-acetylmuramoyl-L-alanine amidase [Nocardioides panacihumi]|uniref:N-acetylmuramoyl-L-alanine amidase n=1 Tax=Nocardioides panacihumi TaxID=400774 RepID=A0ABN2RN70_9ACTN